MLACMYHQAQTQVWCSSLKAVLVLKSQATPEGEEPATQHYPQQAAASFRVSDSRGDGLI